MLKNSRTTWVHIAGWVGLFTIVFITASAQATIPTSAALSLRGINGVVVSISTNRGSVNTPFHRELNQFIESKLKQADINPAERIGGENRPLLHVAITQLPPMATGENVLFCELKLRQKCKVQKTGLELHVFTWSESGYLVVKGPSRLSDYQTLIGSQLDRFTPDQRSQNPKRDQIGDLSSP